jgi:hypothetical protein
MSRIVIVIETITGHSDIAKKIYKLRGVKRRIFNANKFTGLHKLLRALTVPGKSHLRIVYGTSSCSTELSAQ